MPSIGLNERNEVCRELPARIPRGPNRAPGLNPEQKVSEKVSCGRKGGYKLTYTIPQCQRAFLIQRYQREALPHTDWN
jgi:hypothetical protein